MLDLYGTDDLQGIRESVKQRAAAAEKAGNKKFTQTEIVGNHFFDGEEEKMLQTVVTWLKNY